MNSMEEIQRAISRLAPSERAALSTWFLNSGDMPFGVAESAASYDVERGSLRLSVGEYLEFEERSVIKHEYVAGDVYAMSGGTLRHNAISGNVFAALSERLRGGPCRAFISDVKVRIQIGMDELFYYPDVVVACGSLDMEQKYLGDPKLIIEVLSPSTERTDRREKALHYRQIPSLDEYVLVAQGSPEVTIARRREGWVPRIECDLSARAELRSVDLTLDLAGIYSG